ncbi:MAG: hypothetical protein ACFFBD_08185, partial [Candidatus Hodarchaeota archaeon]
GITGLFDAKVRYKRFDTPYIKLKIVLGVILLILSIITLIVHFLTTGGTQFFFVIIQGVLILVNTGLAAVLGLFGTKLKGPVVPK